MWTKQLILLAFKNDEKVEKRSRIYEPLYDEHFWLIVYLFSKKKEASSIHSYQSINKHDFALCQSFNHRSTIAIIFFTSLIFSAPSALFHPAERPFALRTFALADSFRFLLHTHLFIAINSAPALI